MKKLFICAILIALTNLSFAKNSVIVLRDNCPLREDKGNGGVEWACTVPAGTKLELEAEKTITKNLILQNDIQENVSFYRVNYEGKSLFVSTNESYIGTPALITADTVLYTKARLSSFTNAQIEQNSFVVLGESMIVDRIKFREIKYWSSSAWTIRTRFVLDSKISTNEDDIKAIQLVTKAETFDDLDMKNTLLKNAMKLHTSQPVNDYVKEVYQDLNNVIDENDLVFFPELTKAMISTGDGSKVNIRLSPSTNAGISFQLNDQSSVYLLKRTNSKIRIGETKNYWYEISCYDGEGQEISGWCYGDFIKE